MPEQLDTKILPLLPLASGVVLPNMVVTVTLESQEAKAAIDAARSADDTLLLVPKTEDGRYASVGTVATGKASGRPRTCRRPNRRCLPVGPGSDV